MKKTLFSGGLAVALAAVAGIYAAGVSAQAPSRTWSVAVHIEYPDGFIYDHAFATGVPTSELPSMLEACGRSHMGGSGVRFHCYPIPEMRTKQSQADGDRGTRDAARPAESKEGLVGAWLRYRSVSFCTR